MTTTTAPPTIEVARYAAVPRSEPGWVYAGVKRSLDLAISSLALLLATPILLVGAIAIVATSRGPIFFAHERRGRGGSTFRCWKLRTMVPDAHHRLSTDHELARQYTANFKLPDDPRVTRVGRILRKTSIDELPQLWNVIRGDMSLVGPRPVTSVEYERMYGPLGPVVFSVRPGITGLWQVSGRSLVSYERRIELDVQYVQSRSLTRDVAILLSTPGSMLRAGGL